MHSRENVARALELREQGLGARRISGQTGVPVETVRDWLAGRLPKHSRAPSRDWRGFACARCGHEAHEFDDLPAAYVYLLGLYLGDGCISRHRREVYRLRIFLDLAYPAIVERCAQAMLEVIPGRKIQFVERRSNYVERDEPSNVEVSVFSKSWPCLIPQHGPGKKHERTIELTDWQRGLMERHPDLMLRGLIHSDGCRFINTGTNWTCPRYCFRNYSDDIREIFCDACDTVALRYTFAPNTVYVSRKADVQRLDDMGCAKT